MKTEFGYSYSLDDQIVRYGKRLAEALRKPEYAKIRAALVAPRYDVWAVNGMILAVPELAAIDDSGHSGHSWSCVMYVVREILRDSDTPSLDECIGGGEA